MTNQPLPPGMMLRSFLTVGSGYVLSIMSFIMIAVGLGYAFFPDFVEFIGLDKASQAAMMANNPEQAISRAMFICLIGLNFVACIGIGWFVFKTAPFAHFPHAVFLTILLFLYYLQMAIADPPAKKSMTVIYMVAFPIAIMIGANLARGPVVPNEDETLQEQDA
ncbi:MAG: hypothetical protein AB8B55_17875 [Mariniblastus sp.]